MNVASEEKMYVCGLLANGTLEVVYIVTTGKFTL